MKNLHNKGLSLNIIAVLGLLGITMLLSSCEAIGDIFKAGMGVGIFLVVAVVGIIIFFVMRAGKK
jgi:hypothetical protein